MNLKEEQSQHLKDFFYKSDFSENGGVITDLDGTAIHEYQGKYTVPKEVELGLKKVHDLGRPVVINTLRFPLSVMRTFGREWYQISNAPVPTVLMNGSQLGYMIETGEGNFGYEEIAAFPLEQNEIDEVINNVRELITNGIDDVLVFYYPRQWTKGELIWTPLADKVSAVQKKYLSASTVYTSGLEELNTSLKTEDICMIFLLIDIPQDKLMSYQHTKKSSFFTHKGVDKLFGAEQIASHLHFSLDHSVGAGDTEMDTFLKGVGLAIHVGNNILPYNGNFPSLHVPGSSELGELLFELAAMQKKVI